MTNRKEYTPPSRNEAFANLKQGYAESENNIKPNEVVTDFEVVKQRLEAGEYVDPIQMLSYGFYLIAQQNEEGE